VSAPLLELEIGPGPPERRQGLRVLDDGRLEYRGDVDVGVNAEGGAELHSVPLEWRLQWTYTAPELEALRQAIAAADDPPLRASYGPDTRGIHPQEHVWRLRVGPEVREITVRGWPGTRVAALERLWRRLFELHQPPGETSVWRVWTDEGPVERLVDGEVGDVPMLAGALQALFHTEATAPPGEGEPGPHGPPADVPLVEVAFRSEGEEIDRLQVFDDGRQVELREGAAEDPGALAPERMRAIRSALRRVDWPALPQRIEVPR
jgi:hypothetical protein